MKYILHCNVAMATPLKFSQKVAKVCNAFS